jgi:phosphate transport system substrate-binding protein
MNQVKNKPFYKQGWFWGIIIVFVGIYFISNRQTANEQGFDPDHDIHVFTREQGSGTRTAFTEVTGVIDRNGDDDITPAATVQNSTSATMQAVSGDPHAISFISLGSLNDTVRAVPIDGVEPNVENIQSGDYELVRGFNVTYGGELSEVAQDFWDFMFSAQAQELVAEDGYVAVDPEAPEYEPSGLSGSISIVGSTSVEPTMQRFSEAYSELNPDVTIDITAPGSGAGITAAMDGSADIGMSSRDLSESEAAQLTETEAIAIDGIVVIVNNNNPINNLELIEVQGIYQEYFTVWNEVMDK